MAVQSVNTVNKTGYAAFKGNRPKQGTKSPAAAESYNTNTGVITKAALSVPLLTGLHFLTRKGMKELGGITKSHAGLFIDIAAALTAGIVIDKINNNKRAEFAEETAGQRTKTVIKEHDDASLTRQGNVYQHTSTGKKWGALMGAVLWPLQSIAGWKAGGNRLKEWGNVKTAAILAASGAALGFLSGAIIDHFSNNGAAKYADKHAVDETV